MKYVNCNLEWQTAISISHLNFLNNVQPTDDRPEDDVLVIQPGSKNNETINKFSAGIIIKIPTQIFFPITILTLINRPKKNESLWLNNPKS